MSKVSHNKILDVMKGIYSGTWHMRKRERFGKYKESNSRIWEEIECRSKTIGEVRYNRGKRFQKGRVTRKVYCKNILWMKIIESLRKSTWES